MGAITASGSLARVLGPLAVSSVYNNFGLYATSGLVVALMLVTLVITVVTYPRLVPFSAAAVVIGRQQQGAESPPSTVQGSVESLAIDEST